MSSRKRTHSANEKNASNATINKEVEATAYKRVKNELSTPIVAPLEQNLNIVEQLLKKQNLQLFLKLTDAPMTPLHYAAQSGNLEMVRFLFDNGFNKIKPNKEDKETPLHFAVKEDHIEVVNYLMENGFKSELSNEEYHQLIRQCILNDRLEMVKCLINSTEGINDADSTSETLLHCAAANGRLDILNYLIKCGADIKMRTNRNETPLHYAIKAGCVDIVEKLLNTKARKTVYDLSFNILAVHLAAENGNGEIFQMLLKAGFSMEKSFKNRKPIHVAAALGHWKLVSLLAEHGVDIDSAINGETPLHFAIAAGHLSVVKCLLDAGANPIGINIKCEYTKSRMATTVRYVLNKAKWISKDLDLNFDLNLEKRVNILRYLLNYFPEDELQSILQSSIESAFYFKAPVEFLVVLLEYNVEKIFIRSSSYFHNDINSFVHIVDHFEEIDSLYHFFLMAKMDLTLKKDRILAGQYLKIIIPRIALRLHVAENFKIVNTPKWNNLCRFIKCFRGVENEILIMKGKIHNDFDVTFSDILTKSVDKVANYMRSKEFVQRLESSYKKFPAYAAFFERNIQKGKERKELIDTSVNCLFNIVEQNHRIKLPYVVIMKIFENLSVIHLRKLVATCS